MSDTKEKIMDIAEELIRTKGYHAFSYKDISSPLNIRNAAIHYHFSTKADLGAAVIERVMSRYQDRSQAAEVLSVKEQLQQFIDIYEETNAHNHVCFVGALGPAYQTLPEKMQTELRKAAKQTKGRLIEILKLGLESGEFTFDEPVSEKADLIITSLLASLILKRVSGDNIINSITKNIMASV